jgi:hypothetical protein
MLKFHFACVFYILYLRVVCRKLYIFVRKINKMFPKLFVIGKIEDGWKRFS